MKVVINRCFGGFGLSEEAIKLYGELNDLGLTQQVDATGYSSWVTKTGKHFGDYTIPRDDPVLVQVVEQLGQEANGSFAELLVVEIPDDIEWDISEFDGFETVEEKHRSWPPLDINYDKL